MCISTFGSEPKSLRLLYRPLYQQCGGNIRVGQNKGFCRIFTVYCTGKPDIFETLSLARVFSLLLTMLCPASKPMQFKTGKRCFVLLFLTLNYK